MVHPVTFKDSVEVKFKLDTSAEGNVITKDVMNKLSVPISKISAQSFNNQYTPILVVVKTICTIANQLVNLKCLVVVGDYYCILGCKTYDNLCLIKQNVNVKLSEIIADISKEIFEGIGCIKDFEYDSEFECNIAFSVHSPCRMSSAL